MAAKWVPGHSDRRRGGSHRQIAHAASAPVHRCAWLDPWPDSAVPRAGQSLPARTLQLAKAGLGLPATAGTTL